MKTEDNLIEWDDVNPNSYSIPLSDWEITNIKCPKCGERLHNNIAVTLTTYPPMHGYKCFKCDFFGYK